MNAARGDRSDAPNDAEGEHEDSRPPLFEPLRPATPALRAAVLLSGPVLWLAGLIVMAVVIKRANVVGVALLTLVVALLVSFAFLVPSRRQAIRESQEP